MGVNNIAGRWQRAARAMRSDDTVYAEKVVIMVKSYASEAFYAFDDPLEAAIFSVLICMYREQEAGGGHVVLGDVSPLPEPHFCHPTGNPPMWQRNGRV